MKKFASLLLALMLVFSMALPAFAASGTPDPTTVAYLGGKNGFQIGYNSGYSETDLFSTAFKGVMPGDTITQQVTVVNKMNPAYRVKIYMRALGDVPHPVTGASSEPLLSQLDISVTKGKSTPFLYSDDAKADAVSVNFDEWILVGSFNYGGRTTLNVTVDVPIGLSGEELENAEGYLQWEFKAEETLIVTDNPKTGDYIIMAVCVLAVSGTALAVLFLIARKKKKK